MIIKRPGNAITASQDTGNQANQGADNKRDRNDGESDQQRHAGGVDDPAEIVPSQAVCAKQILGLSAFIPDRRPQYIPEVLFGWVERSKYRGQKGHHNDRGEKQCGSERDLVSDQKPAKRYAGERRRNHFAGHGATLFSPWRTLRDRVANGFAHASGSIGLIASPVAFVDRATHSSNRPAGS
jgi:hypothetical protein